MIDSKFWQGMSHAACIDFTRVMVHYADGLAAQLYIHDIEPGEPDFSFIDAETRLDMNISAVNSFGYDLSHHWNEIYDDLFKDFDLPVVDWDEPVSVEMEFDLGAMMAKAMEDIKNAPDNIFIDLGGDMFEGGPWPQLEAAREKYGDIFHVKKENESGLPRLMIMGHARHGKDTVCNIMEELYGLRWVSSSWKCAEKVICRILSDEHFAKEFLDTLQEDLRAKMIADIRDYNQRWSMVVHGTRLVKELPDFVDWAYSVRADYRQLWYQAIRWYNWGDATKLCREIMDEADAYCGIRDARELTAIWNSDLLDDVIWVDASQRLQPEDPKSISVRPEMATLHLDNNHDIERLRIAIMQLMWGQYGLLPKV